jgi:nitrogen fixation/metabolism regulation signal transduction histidine kinase
LVVGILAMAIVLAIWGLIVTHRISGPLFIVARYLDVMADGQYPDVRPLRKRDELQAFFSSFEEAVSGMRNRDIELLRELDQALQDPKSEQALATLKQVRATLSESLGVDQGIQVE